MVVVAVAVAVAVVVVVVFVAVVVGVVLRLSVYQVHCQIESYLKACPANVRKKHCFLSCQIQHIRHHYQQQQQQQQTQHPFRWLTCGRPSSSRLLVYVYRICSHKAPCIVGPQVWTLVVVTQNTTKLCRRLQTCIQSLNPKL